jgi:GT2 family glycosyltransferase
VRALPIPTQDRTLAELLLAGCCGPAHLTAIADRARVVARQSAPRSGAGSPEAPDIPGSLDPEAATCAVLARDAALAAWEADPLDAARAARVSPELAGASERGTDGLRAVLAAVAGTAAPAGAREYAALAATRDADAVRGCLDRELARTPGNLFWLRQTVAHGLYQGEFDRVLAALRGARGADPAPAVVPLLDRLAGEAMLMAGDPEAARFLLQQSLDFLPLPATLERLAEAGRRCGDRDAALAALRAALNARPWNVSATLAAHDLARGTDRALCAPPGRGVVLFYTWNKAEDLDRALAAVFAAELYGARVVVLDNGSTDATPDVLAAWAARCGERLSVLRLPVNVGAPAARNWLLSLKEVRSADWAAYMDDDALVEPDWLGRLGAAVRAYPAAGAWGARVVDGARPHVFQSADLFLFDPPGPGSGAGRGGAREGLRNDADPEQRLFRVGGLHAQVLDVGQFRHLRPCASVTGCVHLFKASVLLENGGFDVRFSPSQYDDLDHDLRLCLAGRVPVFQGHAAVRHGKRTGAAGVPGGPGDAGALGNMFKLQAKHTPETVARIRETVFRAALEDYAAKVAALGSGPSGQGRG